MYRLPETYFEPSANEVPLAWRAESTHVRTARACRLAGIFRGGAVAKSDARCVRGAERRDLLGANARLPRRVRTEAVTTLRARLTGKLNPRQVRIGAAGGRCSSERFRPGRPTIGEFAEKGVLLVADLAGFPLEASSEPPVHDTEPFDAKRQQLLKPGFAVLGEVFGWEAGWQSPASFHLDIWRFLIIRLSV